MSQPDVGLNVDSSHHLFVYVADIVIKMDSHTCDTCAVIPFDGRVAIKNDSLTEKLFRLKCWLHDGFTCSMTLEISSDLNMK